MTEIVLADDRPLIREGLRRILSEFPDLSIVGEATTGIDLLDLVARIRADVVLLSTEGDWPRITTLVPALRRAGPRVVLLCDTAGQETLQRLHSAGAATTVATDASPAELAEVLSAAARGRVTRRSPSAKPASDRTRRPLPQLSNREFEVLRLLGSGRTVVEIAERLGLSPKTVGTYRARVMEKLALGNTAELVRYVLERGLAE